MQVIDTINWLVNIFVIVRLNQPYYYNKIKIFQKIPNKYQDDTSQSIYGIWEYGK